MGCIGGVYKVYFKIENNEQNTIINRGNIEEIKEDVENTEYWVIKIAERIGIKEDTRKKN